MCTRGPTPNLRDILSSHIKGQRHEVFRLDVAMDEAAGVKELHPTKHLICDEHLRSLQHRLRHAHKAEARSSEATASCCTAASDPPRTAQASSSPRSHVNAFTKAPHQAAEAPLDAKPHASTA